MPRDDRVGSDSRCCDRDNGPFEWRHYVDLDHPSVVKFEAWLASLAPFARVHEEGRIDELFDAAADGRLQDSADERTPIKPIVTDPEVWELRLTCLSKKLRFYHAEPPSAPRDLIALHRHFKSTTGPSQQAEIQGAVSRYRQGRLDGWS